MATQCLRVLGPLLGVDKLELIRSGANAVFADQKAGLVVRVNLGWATPASLAKTLKLVNLLADDGLPFLRPALDHPVELDDDRWATIWPLGIVKTPTGAELAELLSAVHQAAVPASVDCWLEAMFGRIDSHLEVAKRTAIPKNYLDEPLKKLGETKVELTDLFAGLPPREKGLVFGDPGANNTVEYQGRRLWIDPDTIGVGPREADLAVLLAYARRFQAKDEVVYNELTAVYGRDLDHDLTAKIAELVELYSFFWLAGYWDVDPNCHSEIAFRKDTFGRPAKWHTTRELKMESVR